MEIPGFAVLVAGTAALSAILTPLCAAFASRIGLVVVPRTDRWHSRPTPLLGGAAIGVAALVALAIAAPGARTLAVAGVCALGAFGLGLLDDFRHIAPSTKVAGQVLVASALALGGVHIELLEFAPLAFILTVFWIVGLMNAVNLLDNMDGLAAGVTVIAGIVLGITALPENPAAAALAAVTSGAALGFLLGTVSLLHTASGAANLGLAVLGPLAILALPIFDTLLVTISRQRAGIPISRGGRDHTSHRLAALGFSDRSVVLVLYGVTAALAGLGLILDAVSTLVAPLTALAAVSLILFGIFLSEIEVYGRGKATDGAELLRRGALGRAVTRSARFGAEIAVDVVLLTTAYYLSYVVRYEGVGEEAWMGLFVGSVPIVVAVQLGALVLLGVYRTLWRYLGVADVVAIARATTVGTAAATVAIVVLFRFEEYSRAVIVLDWLLATAFVVGARAFLLWLRHWSLFGPRRTGRRVLIVGADDRGTLALRLLARATDDPYQVVGFVDDDIGKHYRRISGVPIVGRVEDLPRAVARYHVSLVVVSDTHGSSRDRIRETCAELGVECRDFSVVV